MNSQSAVDPKYKYYLHDLGFLIREDALDAKKSRDRETKNSTSYMFQEGRLSAYYEIITLMQQQAKGFGIDLEDINLEGVHPDKDLV